MPLPTIIFGFVLSTLEASFYHLIRGGHISKYLLLIAFSWTGFWIGHFAGENFGWTLFSTGLLHTDIAMAIGLVIMVLGDLVHSLIVTED